ncbi:MAG: cell division protein ZapA [Methylococcaceae bacterium]|nr:cell division protein ZapA [Methylococcaceae bacterium]
MTASNKLVPVAIKIMGKDYRVACSEEEQETLIQAAHDLDSQMREIRDSGTVNSVDRIAVMAALNLTHELRQAQNQSTAPSGYISNQLTNLRHKIENVLENS